MIHDYYCVNCGNKLKGNEIKFDLAELIGLRDPARTAADPNSLVDPSVLLANAERSGGKLEHQKPCKVELSLKIYLAILGRNTNRQGVDLKTLTSSTYDDLPDSIGMIFSSNENREAAQQKINEYVDELENHFLFRAPEGGDNPDARQNLENYTAVFYIWPEFFENGASSELYTIRYTTSRTEANPMPVRSPEQIRGYCPHCGKPVLMGTGLYPHVMIGLLGAQSAGKTTLIMAMLEEISKNFEQCGINFPENVLCDSRLGDVKKNQELYRKGWAMFKTSAQGENSFNASLILEAEKTKKRMIVTFADIAGEQCYDVDKDAMNLDALQRFPLINSCSAYILCSCLDQKEYGNGTSTPQELPPAAVLKIAKGIYSHLRDSRRIPPLCIFMTKADVAKSAAQQAASKNPLAEIKVSPRYNFSKMLENLVNTYSAVGNEDIREPLRWCATTYRQMSNQTYVSMLSGSALGRKAEPCPTPDHVEMCEDGPFSRLRVDELLRWIFQTVGLTPVNKNGYCFRLVPSFSENYCASDSNYRPWLYTDGEAGPRSEAIQHVFMNRSVLDRDIFNAFAAPASAEQPKGLGKFISFTKQEKSATVDSVIRDADALIQ